jgi:hypothetical protein
VVLEVDEAGTLEALEDGFGGRLFRCGVSGEELRKVDELLVRQKRSSKRAQKMDTYWNDQVVLGDGLFLWCARHCWCCGVTRQILRQLTLLYASRDVFGCAKICSRADRNPNRPRMRCWRPSPT